MIKGFYPLTLSPAGCVDRGLGIHLGHCEVPAASQHITGSGTQSAKVEHQQAVGSGNIFVLLGVGQASEEERSSASGDCGSLLC